MNTVSEMLIAVLIVIAIVLFALLGPRLARWQQEQERLRRESLAREQSRTAIEPHARPGAAAYRPPSGAADSSGRPNAVAVPAGARHGSTARAYLADRSKLRQAIIVATVLGPCRAQEPQDNRW